MRRFGLLILVMLLGPVSLPAQTATGSLSGTVSDATTGRPLAGARIILRGTLLTTEADSAGRFRFGRLEPGTYLLRAAAVGYTSDTLPSIALGAGESRTIAIGLSPQPLELPSLVVTASRRVERIEEAQASIAVLSQDELFRRNVLSVQQALEFVPGVTFNGASSQDPQIDIRGATGIARGVGSRVLTLLDGHPALSADGGEALFKALPLLDVEQVEVVKGAYSALYGSNALGGVVNVLTTRVPDRPQTSARAYYGVYTPQSEYDFT
ncbi:MAG TPA: TonB-dependent receptor plug domain-containing protein, partial [Gemmatimonadales bacterium]|nr:TonB-dependent receptor plug domain-containing protein [Gemmatimonadales bacterium]